MPSNSLTRNLSTNLDRANSKSGDVCVDRKTKQMIFYQGSVCVVSRSHMKSVDASDQKVVGRLLSSQLNKRHAHGAQVTCLEDRLNFKKVKMFAKSPFRNWVLYSDIEHYFVFPDHPNLFMLAIKSDTPGDSLFETYKCKTKAEADLLCEMICHACRDPEKKLRKGPGGTRLNSTLSEVSIHSKAISQPNLTMEVQDSCENGDQNSIVLENGAANMDQQSKINVSSPCPCDQPATSDISPITFNDIEQEVLAELAAPKTFAECPAVSNQNELERPRSESSNSSEEAEVTKLNHDQCVNDIEVKIENDDIEDEKSGMTYFEYHPKHGAIKNQEGPIYMYLKRYECSTGQECVG